MEIYLLVPLGTILVFVGVLLAAFADMRPDLPSILTPISYTLGIIGMGLVVWFAFIA